MKNTIQILNLILISSLFTLAILSCTEESPFIDNIQINFNLTDRTDCKVFLKNDTVKQECVEYEYSNNTLYLKHTNAAFNCCPKKIKFDYSLINNVIIVTEIEEEAACNCLCLYDLNYEIEGLPTGRYVLKFTPTYLPSTEEILETEINLDEDVTGEYCINRYSYPWIE